MSFRSGPSPYAYDPNRDEVVTDVDDAMEENLRSVSR
jgi:hypothetical protein